MVMEEGNGNMPTYPLIGYPTGETAGSEVSSTYEGRHLKLLESTLVHTDNVADPLISRGDAFVTSSGVIVGVAFNDAALTTDYIAVDTEGIWNLSVTGTDDWGASAVVIGDELFISKTSGLISKIGNPNTNVHFGYALGAVAESAATVIAVKVHFDPSLSDAQIKVGSSGAPWTHDQDDFNFLEYRFDNGATGGDNRGLYLQLQMTGSGTQSEALRVRNTLITGTQLTARGAHLTLDFEGAGHITGLGCASVSTLMLPTAPLVGGTYAAARSEIFAENVASSLAGTTMHSIHSFGVSGNETGRATCLNAFEFFNIPSGTGTEMLKTDMHTSPPTDGLRIMVNGALFYIALIAG